MNFLYELRKLKQNFEKVSKLWFYDPMVSTFFMEKMEQMIYICAWDGAIKWVKRPFLIWVKSNGYDSSWMIKWFVSRT